MVPHHTTARHPATTSIRSIVPLLDDGFDPDEKEMLVSTMTPHAEPLWEDELELDNRA